MLGLAFPGFLMPHLTLLDRVSGTAYRVDSTDAVVGRDPSVALVLQGDGAKVVSGRHARLLLVDGQWWVEDLDSRNGTFIGTSRLAAGNRQRLAVGDEIGFGSTGPKLQVTEALGQSYASTLLEPVPAVPMQSISEPEAATAPRPSASSSSSQHVRLVLRGTDGKRLIAQEGEVIIGRSRECAICVEGDMSRAVSRRHARVFYSGWKICIEDLGSRNGTWLNRKRVLAPTIIDINDAIEFGAGGPRLVVENVELVAACAARRTETEMPAPGRPSSPFISELPTPPTARPAARISSEKK